MITRFSISCFVLIAGIGCAGPKPATRPQPADERPASAPPAATTSGEPEGAQTGEKEQQPTEEPEAVAVEKPKLDWAGMNKEQRKELMKTVVLPKMRPLLEGFDSKEFPKVTCITCHGQQVKQGKFEMPNPHLPKLKPANNFAAHKKRWVTFMSDKVVPAMVEALGVTRWSPENKKGFSCMNCHTLAKKTHKKHEH